MDQIARKFELLKQDRIGQLGERFGTADAKQRLAERFGHDEITEELGADSALSAFPFRLGLRKNVDHFEPLGVQATQLVVLISHQNVLGRLVEEEQEYFSVQTRETGVELMLVRLENWREK